MTVPSSLGGKILCAVAGFCAINAAPAAFSGFPGQSPASVISGFTFDGGAASVSSDRLRLGFGGDSVSGAGIGRIEAEGLEIRLKRGEWDIEAFFSGLAGAGLPAIPPVELKNCTVFFGGAADEPAGNPVFFSQLKLTPGDGCIRVEAVDACFGRFQICSFRADITLSGDSLGFSGLTGVFSGGELGGSGELNLGSLDAAASLSFSGVLLEELAAVFPGNASGTARLSFDLSGNILSRSVSGGGFARFSGGNVTGVPVFFGLAPSFLRAAYSEAVFSEGEARFSVDRGAVRLEGARLASEDVLLQASGTLGLDGKLDIVLDASFTESYLRRRPAPVEVLAHVLKACDFLVIRHRVSGTVREPSYELIPIPVVTLLPLGVKRVLGFLLPMRAGVQP